MQTLHQLRLDLRHLLRYLRRSPVSAAVAVLTLTMTLGTGASIFAVVDAVLLTPPPFVDPDALVIAGERPEDDPTGALRAIPYARFMDWRARAVSLATLEALDDTNLTLTGVGAAERITATDMTTGVPRLLGVIPARGRAFTAEDSGRRVILVSHVFWQGRLDADPYVLGRQIVLGGQPHTIVGVLPERTLTFAQSDIWRPLPAPADAVRARSRVQVVARLAPSVTPRALADTLDAISRTSTTPMRAVTTPLAIAVAGDTTQLLALLGGGALVAALVAFTNLAGLLVVRAIDRRRELSLRQALGAPRLEIARQLLLEAATLVGAGAMGGVLVAWWATPVVGRLALQQFGNLANRTITISGPAILLITAGAALAAGLCTVIPATLTTRRLAADTWRRGVTAAPREQLLRRVFVTGVVSCGFVLLVSMTLLGRSLIATLQRDPGFDADQVMTMQLSLPAAAYPGAERVVSFYARLQSELDRRLPAAAIANELPLTGDRGRAVVSLRPADAGPEAIVREVGTRYFDVMQIRLIAGRSFDGRDDLPAPPRAVVSQSLARRLFGSESPIGRQISMAPATRPFEIVGVVGDVTHRALDDPPRATLYLSAWQTDSRSRVIVVRDLRAQADVVAIVRDIVARSDRTLPVYGVRSMREIVDASPGVPARRVLTAAFAGFALLAVVLGAIGVFGIVAHDVAARRPELALRLALGAPAGRLFGNTLRQGAVMIGTGLIVGGGMAAWVARLLGAMGATSGQLDPLSLIAGAMVIIVTALGAVVPVARRAARTDPMMALRGE